jgi:uncharacterized membrane protein required for colicin V production
MLSVIDSSFAQFGADALLIVLIVVNAVAGWKTRTMRRALSLISVYVAFLAAYYLGNAFASILRKGDIFVNAWSFVAVFVLVVIMFEVVGHVLADRIERIAVVAFDRVAGAALGATVGFFQAAVLFMVVLAVGTATPGPANSVPSSRDSAANAVRGAAISGHVVGVEPVLRAVFAPLITTDLTTHLQESGG